MFEAIKSYFTLEFVEFRFRDILSGKSVNVYKDCFGNRFMKDDRRSFFKVDMKKNN